MMLKIGSLSLGLVFLALSLSAQAPRSDLNKQAVRLMTKEVAIRVFDELGKAPVNGLARKIRDSLKVCRQDCDAEKIIVRVVGPTIWKPVREKIAELNTLQNDQALINQKNKDFEGALQARLTAWVNKYATGDAAYRAIAQEQPAIRQIVGDWLQSNRPPEDQGNQAYTDKTGNTNGNGSEGFDGLPPDDTPKSNPWELALLFLFGFGVATGFWYTRWYKSSIKSRQRWKQVIDFVHKLEITDVSLSRPEVTVSELTSLIEVLHKRSTETSDKPGSNESLPEAKPERYDHQEANRSLDRIREIVGPGTSNANLPDAVKRLKEQNKSKSNENNQHGPPRKLVEEPRRIPQAQAVIAYFAEPNADGLFNSDQRADQPSPDTCYRFALPTADATTADFWFEGVPSEMKRFLNLRYHFINSACESENNYQTGYSRVVTLQEGKARLNNGQWRVETKAQIRFE